MRATVWIRVGNAERWSGIKDKSAWINERLEAEEALEATSDLYPKEVSSNVRPDIVKVPAPSIPKSTSVSTEKIVTNRTGPVCKIHGIPLDDRGRCLQKGCKYS